MPALEDSLKQWLPINLPKAPCSRSPGMLLQPESAHPAWQGRAQVPTCSPSQPALWSLCSTKGTMAHSHLQR